MDLNKSNSPSNSTISSINQDDIPTEPRKNEAEVDARIAKIRARNEALLKRRAEVEADRKYAEEKLASVSIKAQGPDEDSRGKNASREPMESPFPEKLSSRSTTAADKGGTSVKDRLGGDTGGRTNPRGNRPTRNEKGDAPPPDPGYNFLADHMRDADDIDKERVGLTSEQRKRDDTTQNRNKFGSHRRGQQADSSGKKDLDDERATNNADKQNGRASFAGSRSAQHSAQAMNSRTSPRSYNDGGLRKPMGAHTRGPENNINKGSASKGFAQARLERNKQRSGSSSEQESYTKGKPHPPYQVPYHPPTSNSRQSIAGSRHTNRQGMNDEDWDDGGGRSNDRGAGCMMAKNHEKDWGDEHWGDGSNNTNKTSPQRHNQYGNRDLRNQISSNLGDRDLRNKISGNSRERDLRNKIGTTSTSANNWDNTSRNRNDRTHQWGGSKEEHLQKDKWDYGDGSNQITSEGSENRRRAVVSDRSQGGRNESRHTNFENLKIEVQFDHSSGEGGDRSNQYESGRQQPSFGNHKRDNFQSARPHLRKPNEKLHERTQYSEKSQPGHRFSSNTFTPSSYSKSPSQGNVVSVPSSIPISNPSQNTNISNWQPMPHNPPPISSYGEGWEKDMSGASWGNPGNISGFQPINIRPNNPNTLQHMAPQSSQEPFSIGEWSAPTDSSSHASVSEAQSMKKPTNETEEDLHEQWLEVQRNWRESSVQSDWAEEVEEQQSPETEDGGSNLQWMPQSEPNQMMHHSTEMYNLPPSAHASFIPVPPSNQPYSDYYPYDASMMQGPPMISHPQSLPPLHPQMHSLPPTTFMTSIPSAHAVAPLHQIHPQQVHNVAAALTQMTHTASQHPIMATHAQHPLPYNDVTGRQYPPPQQPPYFGGSIPSSGEMTTPAYGRGRGNYGFNERRSGYEHGQRIPANTRESNTKFNESSSSSTSNWRQLPGDKDVTKIPPRFQKQRPSTLQTAQNTYSKRLVEKENAIRRSSLPKAQSTTAPETAIRLTVFGTPDIVNNLDDNDMSESLSGIPVRLVLAKNLDELRQKIEMVDPLIDRFVLIHGLSEEALDVAVSNEPGKCSDVDKGSVSDGIAAQFSDLVEDLISRIPYLLVSISTLLPRFDRDDQSGMSCTNNVRKVMNVEISSRFNNNPSITFINNDLVLEWWKDDVKKMRLFCSNGFSLTAYGFSVMLDHWMVKLKKMVSSVDIDISSTTSCYQDDKDESSGSAIIVAEPAACLDRLTEKLSPEKVQETSGDTCNITSTNSETPKLSIDKLDENAVTVSKEKPQIQEVVLDASESMSPQNNDKSDPKFESTFANIDKKIDLTTSLKDGALSSHESTNIKKNESNDTTRSDKNDDTEESFTEKANEEVMEKDLPDGKEEKE